MPFLELLNTLTIYDNIQEQNFMICPTTASLDRIEKGNASVKLFAILSLYFLSVIRPFDLPFHLLRVVPESLRPIDSQCKKKKKKLAASSMLHEAKIAYYAFDVIRL